MGRTPFFGSYSRSRSVAIMSLSRARSSVARRSGAVA